jgi:hypothetical protein
VVGIGRRKMIQTISKYREVFKELICGSIPYCDINTHEKRKNGGDCYIKTHTKREKKWRGFP